MDEEAIKGLVESSRDTRGRVRPKGEAKERIAAYVLERRRAGSSLDRIAEQLGVSPVSLGRWTRGNSRRRRGVMRAVKVSSPSTPLVVHGPYGLRVEGLSLRQLAELLRKLS